MRIDPLQKPSVDFDRLFSLAGLHVQVTECDVGVLEKRRQFDRFLEFIRGVVPAFLACENFPKIEMSGRRAGVDGNGFSHQPLGIG